MNTKDLKAEARSKLALNIHQAIAVYAVEFLLFVTLIALVFMAVAAFGTRMKAVAVVMIIYGVALILIMMIVSGIIGFAMTDYYLASYRCIPYNFRRLGDTIARGGIHKILVMNIVRTLLGFLLLLLLIVPGVIYLSRTAMANNLLIANPRMKAKEALKASGKVMSGKTAGYIGLMMSMLGWVLLAILSLGLGFVFVLPYLNLVKTEYYKRNLQGDRNIYQVQPQPVAQMPMQNQQQYAQPYAQQQPYAAPSAQNVVPQQQAAEPQNAEPQMQPISSVNDNVLEEINQTMREFGGEEVVVNDVPEVPLKPVAAAKAEAPVNVEQNISGKVDDSDIVEIVRPLGTQEVEANVYEQRINDMLAGKPKDTSVKRDYFGAQKVQNANDFFTEEVGGGVDDDFGTVGDSGKPVDDVISDEAFAEFLKNFDTATDQTDAVVEEIKVEPEVKPAGSAATPNDPRRRKTVTLAGASSEDSAARHRREREERLRQLRNSRK